ncbi:DNA polymerase I [Silanimonas sp.]|uniref:DNA polymerase I n=1 Tax=Silanimonas sp. TaxID=1929290 RepID=UPI001BC51991|nr:DNA polymerase I [Silanimonas sp.]MBS3895965.1 DNA polymerase I [Silanimonas sp.]MBS3923775.1 DNA polymerase I [Xanthomonadaceae bacterium]
MPRLVLIDGSSYLYRAFHALPPLTAPDGTPTGALFGVLNMLRATLKEAPEHAAFVLDASGPTFREDLDPLYKANRPPMPDEMRAQIEPMIAIVEALGFPLLRVPGVEADDVIGTLAVQGAAQGIEVTVSTSDKDFAQLVRPGITLTNTMSGSRLANDADVMAKFGVRADQIVDYLALMGDAVDNVPGVDKCGPKTAAKWLAEHGTLDAVIAHASTIGGKIGENLRAALPRLPLNRALVTIRTDVPLDRGPAELTLRPRDVEALRGLFQRYGFHAAARELDGANGASGGSVGSGPAARSASRGFGGSGGQSLPAAPLDPMLSAKGERECVLTEAQLMHWTEALRAAPLIAFDTETDGLDPQQAKLVGISLCVDIGRACYIPIAHAYAGAPAQLPWGLVRDALKPLLEDAAKPKLGQHGKFDIEVLARHGIDVQGYAEDTLLMSFVLDAGLNRHDMDALAERHLGYTTIKYEEVCGKGAKQLTFDQVDLERATAYAAEDADITLRLHAALAPRLAAEPALASVYRDIEMPLVPVLARMESTGVRIDVAELKRQSQAHAKRLHAIEQEAFALAGRSFNLDSPKQLQALLFDELKLPAVVKTPTGQPSTNEEALEAIADLHALPKLILEHRSLAKLKSTYTDKLPESVNPHTGRVHTRYHQAGAATGRLSSSDPNLQNIPIRTAEGRRIRAAFVAPEGRVILACDYSQIELRIMAHLSEDPGLLRAFAEGLDVHKATAAEVFGVPLAEVGSEQRRAAKAINFGLIYGMSAFGLARQLGIERGQAQDYIGLYFARYPGVRAYMERTREQAKDKGYVETVFGRRLHLAEIRSRNPAQRAGAERAAINAPMQGSAADIIKRAMVAVDAWTRLRADRIAMLMQVHDELVFEVDAGFVDEARAAIGTLMQAAATLRVPLLVDAGVGASWDEAH